MFFCVVGCCFYFSWKKNSKVLSLQCERASLCVFMALVIQQKRRVLVPKSNKGKMGLE